MKKKSPAKPFQAAAKPASAAEQALTAWGVGYTLQPDGTILVAGDIDIRRKRLAALPDLSKVVVEGNFDCSYNRLVDLKGAPRDVGGNFICFSNRLTSLEGAPPKVGGNFYCGKNNLATLAHAPLGVGGSFSCGRNKLVSLEGAPQKAGVNFSCGDNLLVSLKGAPSSITGDFWCRNNPLTSLEYAPASFGKIQSDYGDFADWKEVPEEYRVSDETRARREQDVIQATVLSQSVRVGRPLSFRQRSFTPVLSHLAS